MSDTAEARSTRPLLPELLIASVIFIAINLALAFSQPQIGVNDGLGWDGVQYATVAQQLASGERPTAEAPFVYRVGTPLAAALIAPRDLVAGFRIANLAGNAATVALLVFWFRIHIADRRVRLAMLLAFMLAWHGPVRFFWFYPIASEHLAFAANVAVLLGGWSLRERLSLPLLAGLAAVAFAGTLVRETALLAPAVLPLARLRLRPASALLLLPLAAGLIAFVAAHMVGTQTNTYSYLHAVLDWFREKSIFVYVLGWWNAYGPLLVLPVVTWRASIFFLRANPMLLAFLALAAILGWVGGQDTERYVFWAAPIVYALAGRAIASLIDTLPAVAVASLGLLQLLSERVGLAIPQPRELDPLTLAPDRGLGGVTFALTPLGGEYFDLWSFWMPRVAKAILLGEYAVCAVVIFAVLTRAGRRVPARREVRSDL